ncbi:hypothetical protein [Burkholderia ubonensis]|uniref:hypothetical protein n=1 Tax=Burkholderia ubonensis TaxID=101571 RepID=UPI000A9B0322|nr:hypothetical protein [Burkholderia ubonensis]
MPLLPARVTGAPHEPLRINDLACRSRPYQHACQQKLWITCGDGEHCPIGGVPGGDVCFLNKNNALGRLSVSSPQSCQQKLGITLSCATGRARPLPQTASRAESPVRSTRWRSFQKLFNRLFNTNRG